MHSDEQQQLVDAVQAVHLACLLGGKPDLTISVIFNQLACDNKPGWNIFMDHARFELSYEKSRVKFSLPPDEEQYLEFKKYLIEHLGFTKFTEKYRTGIKYIFEIDFDERIYTEDGLERISKLTNKILQYV